MARQPVYIFEDDDYENFLPLTINRAVFQLRLGIDVIFEKWKAHFPQKDLRLCLRGSLAGLTTRNTNLSCNDLSRLPETGAVFVNGRFIPDRTLLADITSVDGPGLILCNGNLVSAIVPPDSDEARNLGRMNFWGYGHFKAIVKDLPKCDVKAREVRHIWDFVSMNPQQICLDFDRIAPNAKDGLIQNGAEVDHTCLIYSRESVCIKNGAVIDGQVVIDARGGPVFIDSGAYIQPHTHIAGPCFVGSDTILAGGKIREGCSIGPVCKIGGELEETIVLGHSNKFHEGFIGHAYVGEWVNLGAMTTNSDLKNNYGSVRVDLGGGQVDTGMTKVGSFVGDHVKTGIGTMLNTGITIGFACNIFGAGLVEDKFVPPFCWGGTGKYSVHDIDRAIGTARAVMERRGVPFSEIDERLFRSIFDETARQRERLTGMSGGR